MKTLQELIEEFKVQPDCREYTAVSGKRCYSTFGSLAWYFLKCAEVGIDSKWTGDFLHEAQGNGFALDYCEHDVILALDN